MNTQQATPSDDIQQQVHRFWNILRTFLLTFSLVVSGVWILTFYGYCFGFWGRNSLLLQHFFQCKCPAGTEERRYPEKIDVLVSACHKSWVDLSPSGQFLAVYQGDDVLLSYLLDLQTMERIAVPHQPYSTFLTDNLGFRKYPEPHIVDRSTVDQYSIEEYVYSHPGAYVNGDAEPSKLAEAMREAKDVYFIDGSNTVVALAPDFYTNREKSFFIDYFDIPGSDIDRMERFLRENHINFQTVTGFPEEAVSPDGEFLANRDGIFLVDSNQKILDGISFLWLRGWTYDGRGVIYSPRYGGRCLLQGWYPFADGRWCEIEVPQPVLLLKVPEEYLSPTPTP